jgi:hypothetical protein
MGLELLGLKSDMRGSHRGLKNWRDADVSRDGYGHGLSLYCTFTLLSQQPKLHRCYEHQSA